MENSAPYRNPMARIALLVSLVPFLSALSLVGLKAGLGPESFLYTIAAGSGPVLFAGLVLGSGFAVVALTRTRGRRDWRISGAFALQLAALAEALWFLAG